MFLGTLSSPDEDEEPPSDSSLESESFYNFFTFGNDFFGAVFFAVAFVGMTLESSSSELSSLSPLDDSCSPEDDCGYCCYFLAGAGAGFF